MTPLVAAVDCQDREMFKFLYNVMVYLQET